MSDAPRFEHRVLSSGEHSITSPDVKGLCAVADTEAEAREEAERILAYFNKRGIAIRPRAVRAKHHHAA